MRPVTSLPTATTAATLTLLAATALLGACSDYTSVAPTAPDRPSTAVLQSGSTRVSGKPAGGDRHITTPPPAIHCWPGCVPSGPGRILVTDPSHNKTYTVGLDGDIALEGAAVLEPSWWPDYSGYLVTLSLGTATEIAYRRAKGKCPGGTLCPDYEFTMPKSPYEHERDGAVDPTGHWLAYTANSTSDGSDDLYFISTSPTDFLPSRLTAGPGADRWPHWAPDGQHLVFASQEDNPGGKGPFHIVRIDLSGARQVLLPGMEGRYPVYSPDGQRIAFTTSTKAGDQLAIMNADGSNVELPKLPMTNASRPSWSQDGQWIAVASTDPAWAGVDAIRVDGSEVPRHLTRFGSAPKWSR